jgi:hypothetical protein
MPQSADQRRRDGVSRRSISAATMLGERRIDDADIANIARRFDDAAGAVVDRAAASTASRKSATEKAASREMTDGWKRRRT